MRQRAKKRTCDATKGNLVATECGHFLFCLMRARERAVTNGGNSGNKTIECGCKAYVARD